MPEPRQKSAIAKLSRSGILPRTPAARKAFRSNCGKKDRLIQPMDTPGMPIFRGYTEGDVYYGYDVVLHYDGKNIDTDNTEVRVLTPEGQRVVAEFDLAKLL